MPAVRWGSTEPEGDDVRKLERVQRARHQRDGDGKAKAAQKIHPQRAEAVVHGLLGARVADEQKMRRRS